MRVLALILVLAAHAPLVLPVHAQFTKPSRFAPPAAKEQPPPPEADDFARWVAEGKREQIPWKVRTYGPHLTMDQQLQVGVNIHLAASRLRRFGTRHELVLLARVAAEGGDWLAETEWLVYPIREPLANRAELVLEMEILLKPGRYRMGVVLLDRISGFRNVALLPIDVKRVRNDPLPALFDGLPQVQFITNEDPHQRPPRPHATKRRLHIQNTRLLHVEVLAAFSLASEDYGLLGKEGTTRQLLEFLDPLAALVPDPGTLRFTGLDMDRGLIAFDVDFTESPGWDELHTALKQLTPEVVAFDTLANREKTENFVRQFIEERLRADLPASGRSGPPGTTSPAVDSVTGDPLRILIILELKSGRSPRSKIAVVSPPEDCSPDNCRYRVYYIRRWWSGGRDLGGILKPLKPQILDVVGAVDYRKVLARIFHDLGNL